MLVMKETTIIKEEVSMSQRDPKREKCDRNCVCEVVRAIKHIQDIAEEEEECFGCPSNCFIEPLGDLVSRNKRNRADTRVFVLKTADGSPFHSFFMPFHCHGKNDDSSCVSIFHRVEEIFDNCCATLRVLRPIGHRHHEHYDEEEHYHPRKETINLAKDCCIDLNQVCKVTDFESTGSCITVDLRRFSAVQCIRDVYLGICD